MDRLKGRVILISGGARGPGARASRDLAQASTSSPAGMIIRFQKLPSSCSGCTDNMSMP
jgi:hypothetical protein